MNKRCTFLLLLMILAAAPASAQLYTGLSGLIHTPSADMNEEGTARIGSYFMNSHFTPDDGFSYGGKKYNTADFYLSVVPFSWVEIGYTFTLMKLKPVGYDHPSYSNKDRYFSLKLQPLREGKYWPAIAVGGNDIFGSPSRWERQKNDGAGYFCNYYVAATKHFTPGGQRIGVNVAYRYCRNESTRKWNGIVGGITWQPSFAPALRTIAEYTGDGVNVGADCLLWKHLFLQAALQDGRYFSGGACFQVNLF